MTASNEGNIGHSTDSHTKGHSNQRHAPRTFADQTSRVVDEAQELGRVALANASEAASDLREKGRHVLEVGREKASDAKGKFDQVVAENPLKSVLIAAGVGAALGYMLSRRSK